MKNKLYLAVGIFIVFAAMTTLTRCGSGVGKVNDAQVGAMKF